MTSVTEVMCRSWSPLCDSDKTKADVLVITSELPWPLNTGGHIRSFHVLKALSEQFNVRVIAGVEQADDPKNLQALEKNGIRLVLALLVPI